MKFCLVSTRLDSFLHLFSSQTLTWIRFNVVHLVKILRDEKLLEGKQKQYLSTIQNGGSLNQICRFSILVS